MSDAALLARIAMLERQVAALMRRNGAPFSFARSTTAATDSGPVQTVQARLDSLSVRDGVPLLYAYGLTASPPLNSDLHIAHLDGDRAKAVVIASGHQTYRLKNLGVGDSALYDVRGAYIWLTATGIVINGAGLSMTIQNVPTVTMGTTGTPTDLHVTGAVIAGYGGSDQVGLQTHTHHQPADSHGDTEAATNAPTAGT